MSLAETLVPFGFTALESEVYVFLLKESPATGYRIAQGINKPAANTYKAIQSLQSKGAVLVEEGASRMCRAVPLEELMNRLQKDFERRRTEAEKKLKSIGTPIEDDRVYKLKSRDQILNRMREMLAAATSVALVKLPFEGYRELQGDLAKAAERGVSVSVLASDALATAGVESVVSPELVTGSVSIVTDGAQSLMGVMVTDSEAEAVWTQSPVIAQNHHVELSAEITLAQTSAMLAADEKRSRIARMIEARKPLPQKRSV